MPPSTVDLCLACSSSLPPHRPSSSKLPGDTIFRTSCCNKPICPTCISSNPRLSRYNPCLHCLNGVGVVHARSPTALAHSSSAPQNFDGGVHDEDVFALGDDEDDSDDEADSGAGESTPPTPATPPPAYAEVDEPADAGHGSQVTPSGANNVQDEVNKDAAPSCGAPSKYYIQPKDTLVGIALRFGVDGRLLCRLNGLPPSTLRTTPHHLHTRTVLTLPPSARGCASSTPDAALDAEREAQRARERAAKRLQTVTKETDWRIAKAYVALAEEGDEPLSKEDMSKKARMSSTVEGRAMDQYLDDEEWEAQERSEGRAVRIPRIPFGPPPGEHSGKNPSSPTASRWRRW